MTMALPDSGLRAPLEESIGIDVRDGAAGVVHLPIVDYVRNSLGAVQGGMMAALATTAAERSLSIACAGVQRVVDLQVTYLSLARVGPVATRTTVVAAAADGGDRTRRADRHRRGRPPHHRGAGADGHAVSDLRRSLAPKQRRPSGPPVRRLAPPAQRAGTP